jgi:hypothetical protein
MKIVGVDNFARESVADKLICTDIADTALASYIAESLNAGLCNCDHADTFYRAVPDDYRLWRGMEDLV